MEAMESGAPNGLPNCRHSAETGEIFKALVEVIPTLESVSKDAENPHFRSKYADLTAVMEVVRPALAAKGIAILQPPTAVEDHSGMIGVTTILLHSSGQWLASELRMTPKDSSPQSVGSAITYARRYGISGLLGITTEDDDGNAASGAGDRKKPAPIKKPEPPKTTPQSGWIGQADLLSKLRKLKEDLFKATGGDDVFYAVLGSHGYEQAMQIPSMAVGMKIHGDLLTELEARLKK